MDFVTAVKSSLMKWGDFRGLASRAEFWWFQLFLVLANFAVLSIGILIAVMLPDIGPATTGTALIALWVLALVPNTALSVRRLRDGGFSWGLIFLALVPLGGLGLLVMYLMPTKSGHGGGNSRELGPTEAASAASPKVGPIIASSRLERLAALHASGTINDQQFELAKKKLGGRAG